uniref:ABC transporter domain-containing protein n=1 Tax=Peronospora matthiolae TaxID=2874970 RepID=A0AAV1TBA1_9STRA
MTGSSQCPDPHDVSPLVNSNTSITDATAHGSSELFNSHRQSRELNRQISSPADFGGLGTRQYLQKHLITPGSATSASSFEEGGLSDGFSDAGTLSSDRSKSEHGTTSSLKHMTKKLSSPSRESLARHLVDTKFETSKVDMTDDGLLSNGLLGNLVVKQVPFSFEKGQDSMTSMVEVSSQALTTQTQEILEIPRKKIRRVVIRRTGADGRVRHEEVRYVDADGKAVQQRGQQCYAEDETTGTSAAFAEQKMVSPQVSTSAKILRRVVVRRTEADGQVYEEVKYLDVLGNIVRSEGRRVSSSSKACEGTRHIEVPVQTSGRTSVQTTEETRGVAGEEMQHVAAAGNVAGSNDSALVETCDSEAWQGSMHESSTETLSTRKVTRRVLRRTLIRKDGTHFPTEECMNLNEQVIQDAENTLGSARSFSDSVSSVASNSSTGRVSRRTVTRRVVSPERVVRRMVVRNGTTRSCTGAEVDGLDEVDAESIASEDDVTSDGSLRRSSRGIKVVTGSQETWNRSRQDAAWSSSSSDHSQKPANAINAISACSSVKLDVTTTVAHEGTMKIIAPPSEVLSSSSALTCVVPRSFNTVDDKRKAYNVGDVATVETLSDTAVVAPALVPQQASTYHEIETDGEVKNRLSINGPATMVTSYSMKPDEKTEQHFAAGRIWVTFDKSGEATARKAALPLKGDAGAIASETFDTSLNEIADFNAPEAASINDRKFSGSSGVAVTAGSDNSNWYINSTAPTSFLGSGVLEYDGMVLETSAPLTAASQRSCASRSHSQPEEKHTGGDGSIVAVCVDKPITESSVDDTEDATPVTTLSIDDQSAFLSSMSYRTLEEHEDSVFGSSRETRSVSKSNDRRMTMEELQTPMEIEEAFESKDANGSVGFEALEGAESMTASEFCGFYREEDMFDYSAAMNVNGSGDTRVNVACEGGEEASKLSFDVTSHDSKTSTAAIQVESLRHSTSFDGTLTTASGLAASIEKVNRDSVSRPTELIDPIEPEFDPDEHYIAVASPCHGKLAKIEEGVNGAVKPCVLAWNKLSLKHAPREKCAVGDTLSGCNKVLLDDVSGLVRAQEFLVITGPSNKECLALLSCLAGYEDDMEGIVTLNGHAWNNTMHRSLAYVVREDLFYETLTVQEHLLAQLHLRMSHTYTDKMCLELIEQVMKDMGLSCCRDKLIGGGIFTLRGLTRGERKLLAVAAALLTNPSILFVEEPTVGLDTISAEKVVAKLRWLAIEKGLTVVTTVHHPYPHSYELFDRLYLIGDTSCVYDGKASDCVEYLSTLGYPCPNYRSPMDHFMLQMDVGGGDKDHEDTAGLQLLKREWAQHSGAVYDKNAVQTDATSQDFEVDGSDCTMKKDRPTNCCSQLWIMWARHIRRLSRYGFVFWWHLLAALLIGVVFGLVYLDLDLTDEHGIKNFCGSFFYVLVVQMIFSAYRSFLFLPRETAIALRECQENGGSMFTLLSWLITKNAAELPSLILLSIAMFVPVFLLVGIGHGFKVYVYMQITIVLAGWTSIGLVLLTIGMFRHVTRAVIAFAALMMLCVYSGGLLIHGGDIPGWLVWLHHISPIKYGYGAMMTTFWKRVDTIDCDWTLNDCVAFTGNGVLIFYGMESESGSGDALVLAAICVVIFFVAFWFLLVLAKKRTSALQWRYEWTFSGYLGQPVARNAVDEKLQVTRSSLHRASKRKSHCSLPTTAEVDNHYIRVETPRGSGHAMHNVAYVTLGWSNLRVEAPKNSKESEIDRKMHDLLSDASGSAQGGELVLVSGPSREANVMLLECLGGLQKTLEGDVTINGVVATADKVSKHAAYVACDDLFYKTLTVMEHLQFQAQLIADKSSNGCGSGCGSGATEEMTDCVDMVLEELALTSQRHVLIQNLSNVNSKLLAIATALLNHPSILLVEDPTCGLDFYSSQRVVLALRRLARGGRTVLVTMTHTSSHLYALFDALYLLAGGAAIYHGKASEAVPYFSALGYQCPRYSCPVDFLIRLVSGGNDEAEMNDYDLTTRLKEVWSTQYVDMCPRDSSDERTTDSEKAAACRRAGCCTQLSILFSRQIQSLARYRVVFGWHAFCAIVASVLFGLIFFQLDLDNQRDIQNWAGAFLSMIMLQMLVMAYRTLVYLPFEMSIVKRERRQGRYPMVCWYLTKVLADIPATLVLSTLLFLPAYWLTGIGHGFSLYFYMQIVMWLVSWTSTGIATLLLGLFGRVRMALMAYLILLPLFAAFAGLLIDVDDIPDFLNWVQYLSPMTYGFEALMKLFWSRTEVLVCGRRDGSGSAAFASVNTFVVSSSGSQKDKDDCIVHSGDQVLSHYSLSTSRTSRTDSIVLLELAVLYFFLGYIFLSIRWRRFRARSYCQTTPRDV